MTKSEKAIKKAQTKAKQISEKYNAPVVWMGGNKFIVAKDGKEIKIEE